MHIEPPTRHMTIVLQSDGICVTYHPKLDRLRVTKVTVTKVTPLNLTCDKGHTRCPTGRVKSCHVTFDTRCDKGHTERSSAPTERWPIVTIKCLVVVIRSTGMSIEQCATPAEKCSMNTPHR